MAKLPEKTTLDRVNLLTEERYPRPHLGGSVLGHECRRYLLYSFRWAYKDILVSKLNRIFKLGDAVEDIIVKDLERVGIIHTGSQDKVGGYKGHAGGSIDGRLVGVPEYPGEEMLFEAKSMNHTYFLEIQRKGLQISKPTYYSQMTVYMGKLNLFRGMFVALDKNTCDLYIEFIKFDPEEYSNLLGVEKDVIDADNINEFPRISHNPSWYQCKYCSAKDLCHNGFTVELNCRTCKFVNMADDGKWICTETGQNLSVSDQRNGCNKWKKSRMWE